MIGVIVKHPGFGLGKIESAKNGLLSVKFFFPPSTVQLTVQGAGLKRAILPLQSVCTSSSGRCRIKQFIPGESKHEPFRYKVEFDNGLEQEVFETELGDLEESPPPTCPLQALSELRLEGIAVFKKREAFANTYQLIVRGAAGLRALLSSRIDLRPHQAYVAGTVLMDRSPRYLLADEVGLGKTIEAGIVLHDLLDRKPTARVLIMCPGTLAQQWLCELYSKFSGRVFSLFAFHAAETFFGKIPDKLIIPYSSAVDNAALLKKVKWDLVIIDEAHRLLNSPRLYKLARELSRSTPGFLLLSAVPAQHREDEYLRLLALLEPKRYNPDDPDTKSNFKLLYDRQIDLGRKLSYISRRLESFIKGDETADRILQKLIELISFPVLKLDESLAATVSSLDADSPDFVDQVHQLLHNIGDRYRINRRILRNRRSQLIDSEPDLNIVRTLNRVPFDIDQLELDAGNATRNYLRKLRDLDISDTIFLQFSRLLFQALCAPECLLSVVELAKSSNVNATAFSEIELDVTYHSWNGYVSLLWGAVKERIDPGATRALFIAAKSWNEESKDHARTKALVKFLNERHNKNPRLKFLVFAGFPGLCPRLHKHLIREFKNPAVAHFSWAMDDSEKEKEVLRYKRDENCWILVSDETGGEGRNFQFADELIHFDLPWHVAKIEQRIGRLDRLGRSNLEVCSNVIYSEGGEDDGFLSCLESGFQIFNQSISGLEFSLARLEDKIISSAVSDGYNGLLSIVNDIRDCAGIERASDEVQGVLDAASIERNSAEAYRRVQSTSERDLELEKTFCDYFKTFSGNGAIRFKKADDYPEGIIEFRPNQVPRSRLPMTTDENDAQPDRIGTFRREIAQERPDLEFFSVGNEFFDVVCATLIKSAIGRSYAIECRSERPPWRGFEFSYFPVGDRSILDGCSGLTKHLDRVFAVRTEHFFVGEDLIPFPDGSDLLAIRKSLTKELPSDCTILTLQNGKAQLLADHYTEIGWDTLVVEAEKVARDQAKQYFTAVLEATLESDYARIDEQIRQADLAEANDWNDEITALNDLRDALENWELELDTVGFLSINGGIIR